MHYIPSLKTTAEKSRSQSLDISALTGSLSARDSLAVDKKRAPLINEIRARLRRANYSLRDDETVDAVRLDQAMASADVSLNDRFAIKSMLRQAQMLPRYS